MSFKFTIEGAIIGMTENLKDGSTVLKIQAEQRARFDSADVLPAPVLIRVPRHIPLDGLVHREQVTVSGNAGVGSRVWHEKNAFGKETGRTKDIFMYTFEAETVVKANVSKPAKA